MSHEAARSKTAGADRSASTVGHVPRVLLRAPPSRRRLSTVASIDWSEAAVGSRDCAVAIVVGRSGAGWMELPGSPKAAQLKEADGSHMGKDEPRRRF